MQNAKVLILTEGKLIGPFDSQGTADGWIDKHELFRRDRCELYSVWDAEQGTEDKAHECGIRLVSIDEATRNTSSRKASGA